MLSFLVNLKLNFKREDNKLLRYIKFILVIQLGALISSCGLKILIDFFTPLISKIITVPFVVAFQFLLNKKWVFK
jgi:putative flippase GtrA